MFKEILSKDECLSAIREKLVETSKRAWGKAEADGEIIAYLRCLDLVERTTFTSHVSGLEKAALELHAEGKS